MNKKHGPRGEIVVCMVDVAAIVAIAVLTHHGSLWNLDALAIEWLLIGVSALLAAFLLRLAGIGLDGQPRPATRYAVRTLALWLVVQGFVFLKMIALTTATVMMLTWFFDWTIEVGIVLVVFRVALSIARRRSLRVPATPARIAVVGSSERLARIVAS
ncbi:undecaprenyl-phosphate glucose phosphotransferase, partial [Burkholderia cenocepacia]|nr:undecaprenyl-phosphate glucose phosphotransferase [Burkholderia cenocepacia]